MTTLCLEEWAAVLDGCEGEERRVALLALADELPEGRAAWLRGVAHRLRPGGGEHMQTTWKRPCWNSESYLRWAMEDCDASDDPFMNTILIEAIASELPDDVIARMNGLDFRDRMFAPFATARLAWLALLTDLTTED